MALAFRRTLSRGNAAAGKAWSTGPQAAREGGAREACEGGTMGPVSIDDLKAMKERGQKIAMLTAYDYPTARLLDEAGVPIILVGDSPRMGVRGGKSTRPRGRGRRNP